MLPKQSFKKSVLLTEIKCLKEQLLHGGNPFVAPESWHDFLTDLKGKVQKVMAANEKLEQEMKDLGIK